MAGGRRQDPPPLNGGDSLFQLVQTHHHPSQFPPFTPPPFRPHSAAFDPAVGPIFHLPINAPGRPHFPPPSATGASFFPLCPPNFFVHGGHGFFHHLRSPPLPPSPGFADPQFVFHRQRNQEQGKLPVGGKTSLVGDDPDGVSEKKKHRGKEFRSDPRGIQTLSQSLRNWKRLVQCRVDIERFNSPLIEIYESLIPAEEEKGKQKNLLARLENLVRKEWPNARLHLYGSCANSFAFSGSDLDVCLRIGDQGVNKPEVLLKLAELLLSNNLENVQALTHARVPIVKLKDPVTGLSCDISINNVFAVENTKLIQDYAQVDDRLIQLVFIVKHWAKRRGINEAYMGTLPSYAYVLMCIHFLQQRKPAILPCLQGMNATYTATVDNTNIAYFDQVERLKNYGRSNTESLAQLVWGFFHYWAYCHDYTSSVISVRTGSILSKQAKGWTRRVGNDRHLICIEDPFETSNDVGRVVDRRSIWVIREEFERAAQVLQGHPNPCVELFEPYAPP